MKTLYYIRHAKSSWEDASLADLDRPLNKRGLRDAPFMATRLFAERVYPDLILASPSVRTLTTARSFAEKLDYDPDKIKIDPRIYEAYPKDIYLIIHEWSNDLNTVLLFGHNPTITEFINLHSKKYIPNVPTCGICKLELRSEYWKDFSASKAVLTDFKYPKQYV